MNSQETNPIDRAILAIDRSIRKHIDVEICDAYASTIRDIYDDCVRMNGRTVLPDGTTFDSSRLPHQVSLPYICKVLRDDSRTRGISETAAEPLGRRDVRRRKLAQLRGAIPDTVRRTGSSSQSDARYRMSTAFHQLLAGVPLRMIQSTPNQFLLVIDRRDLCREKAIDFDIAWPTLSDRFSDSDEDWPTFAE